MSEKPPQKEESKKITYPKRFLTIASGASILLGWWFAFMVWGNSMVLHTSADGYVAFGGIGATLFILGSLALALWSSRNAYYVKTSHELNELGVSSPKSWIQSYAPVHYIPFWLTGWMAIMSLAFTYRAEIYAYMFLWWFYVVAIPLLLGFLFFPLFPKIMNLFNVIVYFIKGGVIAFMEAIKFAWQGPSYTVPVLKKKVIGIVMGSLLLAFLLGIIFTWLLAQADPIFESYMERFWHELANLLEGLELARYGRIFFVLAAPLAFGGMLFAMLRYKGSTLLEISKEQLHKKLEPVNDKIRNNSDLLINIIVLGTLNLIFGAFVFIQVRYLFFGTDLTKILGHYTYAEYAQRGFVEMIVAVVLAYPLLAWFAHRTTFRSKAMELLGSLFNIGLVASLFVVLASAFRRIELYQDAYGYSLRRFFVLLGVIVTAAILLGYVLLFLYKKLARVRHQYRFLGGSDYYVIGLAGLCMLLTLTVLVPWPIFITKANINRFKNTGKIDLVYLYSAPEEALPTLYKFSNDLIDNQIDAKNVTDSNERLTGVLLKANLQKRLTEINNEIVRHKDSHGNIKGSLIGKAGGFNVVRFYNGYVLYDKLIHEKGGQKAETILKSAINELLTEYSAKVASNDWNSAQSFWDQTYSLTDTSELAKEVNVYSYRINTSYLNDTYDRSQYSSYYEQLVSEGQVNNIPACLQYQISTNSGQSYSNYGTTRTAQDYVAIGIRNGRLVIKDSYYLPLAYQDYSCDENIYGKCAQYEVRNSSPTSSLYDYGGQNVLSVDSLRDVSDYGSCQ